MIFLHDGLIIGDRRRLNPSGKLPDVVAAISDPPVALLAPTCAPRILNQPRLLSIVPADQNHDMIWITRAVPVEDAALIDAKTSIAVNRHGEWPVFDQSLFELRDGGQFVGFLFVDIAPSQRAVIGCQYLVAAGGQAVAGIRAF